jgi:anhydro-N-acetylmuramic acid kinase
MERTRLVLGAMTGTSIDGMDLALVRVHGAGLGMRAETVATRAAPLGALAPRLRAAAEQHPMTAGDFAALATEFGELHARECLELLRSAGVARIDLDDIPAETAGAVLHEEAERGWHRRIRRPATLLFELIEDVAAHGMSTVRANHPLGVSTWRTPRPSLRR